MNNLTKISEITYQDVAEYIRLDEVSEDDVNTLNTLLTVAKEYIEHYTGQAGDRLDYYPNFVIVALILCQDMWDNRTLYVDNKNINHVVKSILDMHSVNLL